MLIRYHMEGDCNEITLFAYLLPWTAYSPHPIPIVDCFRSNLDTSWIRWCFSKWSCSCFSFNAVIATELCLKWPTNFLQTAAMWLIWLMFKPLFTASCKVWATQGTLSQPRFLDATVMLLALSCTSATMHPSEIPHSTCACLRQVAMFSPVCRSFVNSTLLSNSHFSFIQWTVSVVYDSVIRLV